MLMCIVEAEEMSYDVTFSCFLVSVLVNSSPTEQLLSNKMCQ